MPDFERLNKELVDKILAVRINRAEPIEKQTEFLNSLPVKITYRSLLDSSDQVAKAYNTRVMPTTYFLNENGVIAQKKLGS